MCDATFLKPGTKVTYVAEHCKPEHGMIKRLCDDGKAVFVVYNCGGEWDRYTEFTAARTNLDDLLLGWQ